MSIHQILFGTLSHAIFIKTWEVLNFVLNSKLRIKLSKFHEQALLSWKLCFVHNFSPHKVKQWNTKSILVKNKLIFLENWHEKDINYLCVLLDPRGKFYSYCDSMSKYNFPVPVHKEFLTVVKAIPNGLGHLMKCHLSFEVIIKRKPNFFG